MTCYKMHPSGALSPFTGVFILQFLLEKFYCIKIRVDLNCWSGSSSSSGGGRRSLLGHDRVLHDLFWCGWRRVRSGSSRLVACIERHCWCHWLLKIGLYSVRKRGNVNRPTVSEGESAFMFEGHLLLWYVPLREMLYIWALDTHVNKVDENWEKIF